VRDAPLLVFLVACLVLMAVSAYRGCVGERPPPRPPADPKVIEQRVDAHLVGDNVLTVKLENAGKDGWVHVHLHAWDSGTDIRREPGAVTWLKNTFTSEGSSGYRFEDATRDRGAWDAYTWMRAGETKSVSVPLRGHSTWSDHWYATAAGVGAPPKDAVLR
jgi:hypothetical protein